LSHICAGLFDDYVQISTILKKMASHYSEIKQNRYMHVQYLLLSLAFCGAQEITPKVTVQTSGPAIPL
jgi:hypothetical protein